MRLPSFLLSFEKQQPFVLVGGRESSWLECFLNSPTSPSATLSSRWLTKDKSLLFIFKILLLSNPGCKEGEILPPADKSSLDVKQRGKKILRLRSFRPPFPVKEATLGGFRDYLRHTRRHQSFILLNLGVYITFSLNCQCIMHASPSLSKHHSFSTRSLRIPLWEVAC